MAKEIRKIKSMSYKDEKGYSRVGGIFKSKGEKEDREKKQARANSFSKSDNKQVAETMKRNTATPAQDEINDYGMYKGGQKFKYKKKKEKSMPKFRGGKE